MSGIHQAIAAFKSTAAASGWAFKSAGTVVVGGNPTVGLPSSHSAGDLLVLVINGNGGAVTSPAGWSVSVNSGAGPRGGMWYKIDSGSESAVAITAVNGTTTGVMLSYSGINATPLDVNGTVNTTSSFTTNSLTTTVANDLVVSIYFGTTGAWTASPAGTDVRVSDSTTGVPVMVVDELMASAGATTARTAVKTGAGQYLAMACSFKPA